MALLTETQGSAGHHMAWNGSVCVYMSLWSHFYKVTSIHLWPFYPDDLSNPNHLPKASTLNTMARLNFHPLSISQVILNLNTWTLVCYSWTIAKPHQLALRIHSIIRLSSLWYKGKGMGSLAWSQTPGFPQTTCSMMHTGLVQYRGLAQEAIHQVQCSFYGETETLVLSFIKNNSLISAKESEPQSSFTPLYPCLLVQFQHHWQFHFLFLETVYMRLKWVYLEWRFLTLGPPKLYYIFSREDQKCVF